MTARHYPIRPMPDDDGRFTFGLTVDVAEVLQRHGYPPIGAANALDFLDLQQTLFRFLYADRDGGPEA